MGIKKFSTAFDESSTVTIKDLAGKRLAIDAMPEIYRAALGAKSVKTLTDRHGNPTMHISVILANIIEMQRYGIQMIWVFDHDKNQDKSTEFHNPAKLTELLKRQKRKQAAQIRLDALRAKQADQEEELFSDTDDDVSDIDETFDRDAENKTGQRERTSQSADQLEKQTFSANHVIINDIKLILNCLNIHYIEAPAGFEGEQIAAHLAAAGIVDGVYSGDTDPIPFGAPVLYRRGRDKIIYEYEQTELLQQIIDGCPELDEAGIDELRKVCLILGCDFSAKTKGVGPKTVFQKLTSIELTDDQIENGLVTFERESDLDAIVVYNKDKVPFADCEANNLMLWLTEERAFTKKRIDGWFDKVMDRSGDITVALPPVKVSRSGVKRNTKVEKPSCKKVVKKSKSVKVVKKRVMPPKKGARKANPTSLCLQPRSQSTSPVAKPQKTKTVKVVKKRVMPPKKGQKNLL
jgi:5'-3' exonuclease